MPINRPFKARVTATQPSPRYTPPPIAGIRITGEAGAPYLTLTAINEEGELSIQLPANYETPKALIEAAQSIWEALKQDRTKNHLVFDLNTVIEAGTLDAGGL